jgi:lysozyme family protein
MIDFDTAFIRLLGAEGKYSNDPADPGGETKWGISKRSYPNEDIANLTREQAKVIYKRDFWDTLLDADVEVKFQVFDFAVNGGMSTAIHKLQFAVGVADDGHWGPRSAASLLAMDVRDVVDLFIAQRMRFYTKLSKWPLYGAGWTNRCAGQLEYAVEDFQK